MSSINSEPLLLAVSEIGGYPNFTMLYEKLGYKVITETSMRKALKLLKRRLQKLLLLNLIISQILETEQAL